jgi:VWFA-related protein
MRTTALAVMAGLAVALGLRAQDPPPALFRGGVDVVHVDVSVLDRDRKPVRGLTANDFSVFENGMPRPIVTFSAVDLVASIPVRPEPGSAAWLREVPRDVMTNLIPTEGRLIAIVFDWSIRMSDQPLARRIARAAVENMGPQDLGAVIFASGFANAGTSQNFTNDKARLLDAISRPMTPAREGIDSAIGSRQDRLRHPWLFDPDGEASGDCLCRVCVFDKVGDIADAVLGIPGRRKTVLFVGTYFPSPSPQPASPCGDSVRSARDRLTRKLRDGNVTIHVVDPSGTVGAEDGPVPEDATAAMAAGWTHTEMPQVLLTEQSRQSRLPFLADLTKGRVVTNDNGADVSVPAILDETSAYYVMAFETSDRSRGSGRRHEVEVRVARRDTIVQFRRSYEAGRTAAALEAEARKLPLLRAVESALPHTDQAMALAAAAFARPGHRDAAVAVVLRTDPTGRAPYQDRPDNAAPRRDDSRSVVAAVDMQGKVVGTLTQSATVPWAPGESAPPPYELFSQMILRPGRYEIRIASELSSGERSGVYGVFEVPDFSAASLALSSIVLQSLPASGFSGPRDAFTTAIFSPMPLPVIPTARRAFATTDRLTAFARLYRNRPSGSRPLIRARIVDADGGIVHEDLRDAEESGYQFDLPIDRLGPGEYLLQIGASAGDDRASRDVRFEVR